MTLIGYAPLIAQPKATVFSVQGNWVQWQPQWVFLSGGTLNPIPLGIRQQHNSPTIAGTPMPYGGKVLKLFVYNKSHAGSNTMTLRVHVNGSEQNSSFRAGGLNSGNIGEFQESPNGEEVTFNQDDEVNLVAESALAIGADDYEIWALFAFNIGSATP